jgi:uncharacterized protein
MSRAQEPPAGASTFIIFRKPGPAWIEGKGSRQQPGWDAHAQFMDELHENGWILVGGPFADYSRVLQIVRCASMAEAEHLFDEDPWTDMGILEQDGVHEWLAFLVPPGWPIE